MFRHSLVCTACKIKVSLVGCKRSGHFRTQRSGVEHEVLALALPHFYSKCREIKRGERGVVLKRFNSKLRFTSSVVSQFLKSMNV